MVSSRTDDDRTDAAASGHERRKARSERSVLDATRELLAENGFGALTVEGVAARAGVAKTTIYRRYRSKNDLALAVLLDMVGDVSTRPYTRDTRSEFVRLVDRTAALLSGTPLGGVMRGLVPEVAADPVLAQVYRERVVRLRVADVDALVQRGVSRDELRSDLDPELVTDLLLGPLYYRFLLSGSPLGTGFGRQLVDTLWPALTAEDYASRVSARS